MVIVETVDAYERMASPLLNRFEKQVSSIASRSYAHFLEYTKRVTMPVPLVHSVTFHIQYVHFLLADYFEQILGWQQAVKLCQPQIVFGRILARLKHLAEGLATYAAEDEQTKAGKGGMLAVVVRRGTILSE